MNDAQNPYIVPSDSPERRVDHRVLGLPVWSWLALCVVIIWFVAMPIAAYHVHAAHLPQDFSTAQDSATIVFSINIPVALCALVVIGYRSSRTKRVSIYLVIVCLVIGIPCLPLSVFAVFWDIYTWLNGVP